MSLNRQISVSTCILWLWETDGKIKIHLQMSRKRLRPAKSRILDPPIVEVVVVVVEGPAMTGAVVPY